MTAQPSRMQPMRLAAVFVLSAAMLLPLPFAMDAAQAQQVRERRSIIDLLFSRGDRQQRVIRRQPRQPAVTRIKRKKRPNPDVARSSKTAPADAALAPAKLPDAKKVLVIGDFMAAALSDGLTMATGADAGIVVEKGTDGSSGLVRTDHLDWPQALKLQIDKIHPSLIVIMLGSNDRQQMSVDGKKEKFRSEAWNTEYERRIAALIDVANGSKVPFIWTGLPSFKSPSLNADAATLNNLYREKAEAAGGVFIDIWDGFADEEGKFIASGSDINGQPVRLRGSDGLSLTNAGKRKMAFYLEKDLRRLLGTDALALDSMRLGDEQNAGIPVAPPSYANILAVPPISLADPELDGTKLLLDTGLMPKSSGTSPRDRLIEKGETVEAPEGRIDDFRWKPVAKPAG